jgi:hypothetical protein
MRSLIVFATATMFTLSACQEVARHPKSSGSLPATAIYSADSVKRFLADNPKEDKESQKLFMDAIDMYRNKKNATGAIDLFEKSITIHPTARAYYELGNACSETKNYAQAIQAYHIAEALNYQPASKLLYNMACVFSLQDSIEHSLKYLEYAIEAGYTNADNMMKDPDLAKVRSEYRFREVITQALGGASDPETVMWYGFKRSFAVAQLPLVLNTETVVKEEEDNYISYDYEKYISEMKDEKFSREVGKEFYYMASVESNQKYTALVYAVKNTMMGEKAPMSFVLISFDPKGVLIDKKTVGGLAVLTGEPYKVCTIKPNLSFEIKEYDIIYEKNPLENGYDNNKVVSNELKDTKYYKIDEVGKFVETSQALTMR